MTSALVVAALLQATVRGAAVGIVALLVTHLARRWSAATRHAILAGALLVQLGFLVTALTRRGTDAEQPARAVFGWSDDLIAGAMIESPTPQLATIEPTGESTGSLRFSVAGIALALMAVGFLLRSGRLVVAWLALRRLRNSFDPIADAQLSAELAQECLTMRVRRNVGLRVGSLDVPLVHGILAPEILMPDASRTWTDDRRRRALRHELAHVARHDMLLHAFAQLTLCLCWWNPVLWMIVNRMRATAERAADDAVLRSGDRASTYVDELIVLVRETSADERLAPAGFAMARRSEFEGRMLALLDERQSRRPTGRPVTLGMAVVVAFAVIAFPLSAIPNAQSSPVGSTPGAGANEASTALLQLARTTPEPIERGELLERALRESLTPVQIDGVLSLIAQMGRGIPAGIALRQLAERHALSARQIVEYLVVADALVSPIEKSGALATLAGRFELTDSLRARYLTAVARMPDGAPRRAALNALER